MSTKQTSLSDEFKERVEAYVEGAIDRAGVADHIPRDEGAAAEAVAYVEGRFLGVRGGGAPTGDKTSRAGELVRIIGEVRSAEVARRGEAPGREGRRTIFTPETIAGFKAGDDEKFLQWKARRRPLGKKGGGA